MARGFIRPELRRHPRIGILRKDRSKSLGRSQALAVVGNMLQVEHFLDARAGNPGKIAQPLETALRKPRTLQAIRKI